jgi:metal-responsive CopG/Arc/MetJ family transcriptional regulator
MGIKLPGSSNSFISHISSLTNKYNRGYTHFMKTAISIPEDVFQSAEALVKRLGMSRSQLYTAAINEYLNRRQDRQITTILDSIYEEEDSSLPSGIIRLRSAR